MFSNDHLGVATADSQKEPNNRYTQENKPESALNDSKVMTHREGITVPEGITKDTPIMIQGSGTPVKEGHHNHSESIRGMLNQSLEEMSQHNSQLHMNGSIPPTKREARVSVAPAGSEREFVTHSMTEYHPLHQVHPRRLSHGSQTAASVATG